MEKNIKQRKIILDLAVTLDGFIEGENGEVDWCIMEPEMNFTNFLNQIDTILYGYNSYQLWGEYTPTSQDNEEQQMWNLIHSKEKYVFSKLHTISNTQVTLIRDNIFEEMTALKNQQGKDIWLYGGSSLITSFIDLNLIDEFRISLHPIVLGNGKPLFSKRNHPLSLKLIHTNVFSSGVIQLIYHNDS